MSVNDRAGSDTARGQSAVDSARSQSQAFTLIELLVVIVILGILMAVAVPTFLRQQTKAQDSRTQQYLTTAYKAIRASTPETNNLYPAATSIVSWIQQSEPEITSARGTCLADVISGPADEVFVDPSSNSNALTLCARSKSGNVWKLAASATGAPAFLDGTLVPLSFGSGEITDSMRAAALQGDGRASDSSTGIWSSSRNLETASGFETGTTGWGLNGAVTVARDTSTAKFGSASGRFNKTAGTFASLEQTPATYMPASAGAVYTVSAWFYAPSSLADSNLMIRVEAYDAAKTFISRAGLTSWTTGDESTGGGRPYVPTSPIGSWFRAIFTLPAAPAGTAYLGIHFLADGTTIASPLVYIDGIQLEQKTFPTPYIETDGAAVTRSATNLQLPAGVLDGVQGWLAIRLRADKQGTYNYDPVWSWDAGVSIEHMTLMFTINTSTVRFENYSGATQNAVGSQAGDVDVSTGQTDTIVVSWTATSIAISGNGNPFRSSVRTVVPNLSSAPVRIGANGWDPSRCSCDLLWLAAGNGTLSNADAATINSFGDTDPKRSQLPGQPLVSWDGSATAASLK